MATDQVFKFYSEELKADTIQESDGTQRYYVEGYVSTGDLDLVNDIVTKKCLDSMLSQFDRRNIKLDFEHETMIGETELQAETSKARIPLGKAVNKGRDEKGVLVQWELNPAWKKFDQKGDVVYTFEDIWRNVTDGFYDAFSIAFVPTQTKGVERDGQKIRLLDDVNLLNVALTGNPVNQGATMSAAVAKSLEALKNTDGTDDESVDVESVEVKDKNSTEQSFKGGKMTEDVEKTEEVKDTKPEEKSQAEETPETEGEVKSDDESKPEEKSEEPEGEVKSDSAGEESSEFKNLAQAVSDLKAQIEGLSKENEEFKSFLKKANRKSLGAEDASEKDGAEGKSSKPSVGPLDQI